VAIATVPGVAHLGSVPGDKFISATGAFPDGVGIGFLSLHTRSVTIENRAILEVEGKGGGVEGGGPYFEGTRPEVEGFFT
jgi:hypothetical protein